MEELIPITLFMCIAAVAILRPISTKLGGLLEAMRNERTALRAGTDDQDLARLRVLMEHVAKRVDLIEERLDFTERLLNGSRRNTDSLRSREADLLRAHQADAIGP